MIPAITLTYESCCGYNYGLIKHIVIKANKGQLPQKETNQ